MGQRLQSEYPVAFCRWITVAFLLTFFFSFSIGVSRSQAEAPAVDADRVLKAEKLWNRAMDHKAAGDRELAATIFLKVYQNYSDAPMAEDSLWQAIQYYKSQAVSVDPALWPTVEELYRRFIIDFSNSRLVEQAQFDIALLKYERQFFRDALARFKVFAKRFPDSPLLSRARYLQAKALLQIGQLDAAFAEFSRYTEAKDPYQKAQGLAGLGEIHNRRGEHEKALKVLREALRLAPVFFLNNPEADIYRELGTSYLKMGNEEYGRRHLFHYLNIMGQSKDRLQILTEIAESYYRQGDATAAQGLYEHIIAEGDELDEAVKIANFRLTQFRDDPNSELTKWQRRGDYKDSEEDVSYEKLLESSHDGDLAQEARRGLFRRYVARGQFVQAYDTAKAFLRQLDDKVTTGPDREVANEMLLYVVENLLAQKKYDEVYAFYRDQHRHLIAYPGGRVRYLVGQALEELALYQQASVVYYRALAEPLSQEDKTDLYYRRVRLYLRINELESAAVLLRFLQEQYRGTPQAAEVYFLSGRLAEKQERKSDAQGFYGKAVAAAEVMEKKAEYAAFYLRMLMITGHLDESSTVLDSFRQEKLLTSETLQNWYLQVGEALIGRQRYDDAAKIFNTALGEEMPAEGRVAQKVELLLGDVLLHLADRQGARDRYEKVRDGADPVLKSLAAERLQQMLIEESMEKIDVPVQ